MDTRNGRIYNARELLDFRRSLRSSVVSIEDARTKASLVAITEDEAKVLEAFDPSERPSALSDLRNVAHNYYETASDRNSAKRQRRASR
jgi:hypothetical protein